jgi:hypothetical protein
MTNVNKLPEGTAVESDSQVIWPEAIASDLRRAFPGYEVIVRRDPGRYRPRYQLRARDDAHPYCLISPDPDEIRAALSATDPEVTR